MSELDIASIPENENDPFVRDIAKASGQAHPSCLPGPLGLALDAASEAMGVATGTFDFFFGSSQEGAAQDPATQEAIAEATAPIPNQDIIYEQLAHNLAYGKYDVDQLRAWGYGPPKVVVPLNELTGMFVVAVEPDPARDLEAMKQIHGSTVDVRTVVAFRGSTDAVDWADDTSPEGIGAVHFAAHKAEIAAALAKFSKNGPPDVTGHSLGGALAQMAATVGAVNRVVTFQSPGIPPEMAALVGEDVQSTHHRAAGDPVAWAGGDHLEGEEYIYNQTRWEDGTPHTSFLLDGLNTARGGAVPEVYDSSVFEGVDYEMTPDENGTYGNRVDDGKAADYQAVEDLTWVSNGAQDMDRDGETDWYEELFDAGRGSASELIRSGVGEALRFGDSLGLDATRGVSNVINAGTSKGAEMTATGGDMQLYLDLWAGIEPRIGKVPADLLVIEIDAAPFEDDAWAEQMKSQVFMSGRGGVLPGAPSYVPSQGPSYVPAPFSTYGGE